jgi:hypothetical protein
VRPLQPFCTSNCSPTCSSLHCTVLDLRCTCICTH